MLLQYLTQFGILLAFSVILAAAWLRMRRGESGVGIWLKFGGALFLVLIRVTDSILFDPFIGVLRPHVMKDNTVAIVWGRFAGVSVAAGLLIVALSEAILYWKQSEYRGREYRGQSEAPG